MMIILYDFSMAVNQNISKKRSLSLYFKFIWIEDFYALVTEGLKWLTVSITLVSRINLLWKQIGAPVGFGCKFYIRQHSENDFKVSIVFEMIDFQWT